MRTENESGARPCSAETAGDPPRPGRWRRAAGRDTPGRLVGAPSRSPPRTCSTTPTCSPGPRAARRKAVALAAEEQSAGRGRRAVSGRPLVRWLMFSLLLRPQGIPPARRGPAAAAGRGWLVTAAQRSVASVHVMLNGRSMSWAARRSSAESGPRRSAMRSSSASVLMLSTVLPLPPPCSGALPVTSPRILGDPRSEWQRLLAGILAAPSARHQAGRQAGGDLETLRGCARRHPAQRHDRPPGPGRICPAAQLFSGLAVAARPAMGRSSFRRFPRRPRIPASATRRRTRDVALSGGGGDVVHLRADLLDLILVASPRLLLGRRWALAGRQVAQAEVDDHGRHEQEIAACQC